MRQNSSGSSVGDRVDFSILVRDLRHALGLTQEQLARELSVTFSTVNGWENRKHHPIPALAGRLLELAGRAGVSPRPLNVTPAGNRRLNRSAR